MAFFALRFISPEVVQRFFGSDVPLFNIAAAGLAVGLLVTPLVASVAEDAMHAVPNASGKRPSGWGSTSVDQYPHRYARRRIGHHCGPDPGHLPGDRRDDDRRHRRRRHGRLAVLDRS
jgi:hypothetical protein